MAAAPAPPVPVLSNTTAGAETYPLPPCVTWTKVTWLVPTTGVTVAPEPALNDTLGAEV